MRIVLITQDEPFYLEENLEYLIELLPEHSSIVGCVVTAVSPFGKKEGFLRKAKKTAQAFGLQFFFRYSWRYVINKLWRRVGVRRLLRRFDIPEIVLQDSINHRRSLGLISQARPDLLISILGNEIFKRKLIDLAPQGCLNLHSGLLPKYRGLMPTFWVMRHNESVTGVSVFFVDEGIDSGPIVVQKRIEIGASSLEELIRRTKRLGMEAVAEAVDLIEKGSVDLIENDAGQMSYHSFPTRSDVQAFRALGKKFF